MGALTESLPRGAAVPAAKPVVWMFSGQGSQAFHMGRDLYDGEPVFRRAVDLCSDILEPRLGLRLADVIYAPERSRADPFSRIRHANPAICVVQYAMARLLGARGYAPDLVFGYSLGEVTAAVIAGALSLEEGLGLALRIAELAEELAPPGGMLAVLGDAGMAQSHPDWFDGAWISARNFDGHFVVSGRPAALDALEACLRETNIPVQRLPVDFGFHSPLIEPIGEGVRAYIRSLTQAPATIDMVSATHGRAVRTVGDTAIWTAISQPVPFAETVVTLDARGPYRYVDLGPAGTMATFVKYGLGNRTASETAATITPFGNARSNLDRFFPSR